MHLGYVIFIQDRLKHKFIIILTKSSVFKLNTNLYSQFRVGDLLSFDFINHYINSFEVLSHRSTCVLKELLLSSLMSLIVSHVDNTSSYEEILYYYIELFIRFDICIDSDMSLYSLYIFLRKKIVLLFGYDSYWNRCFKCNESSKELYFLKYQSIVACFNCSDDKLSFMIKIPLVLSNNEFIDVGFNIEDIINSIHILSNTVEVYGDRNIIFSIKNGLI